MFFLCVYVAEDPANSAREEKNSEADKQQANKKQTIVIRDRTAGGSTCPAATRLLGKPGLLHTSHCDEFYSNVSLLQNFLELNC